MAFGVIATMLVVAQFPMFVIIFFGIFAYFLWRTFSQPSVSGVRTIFDFYIDANNILRNDERKFFGFEINEVISRGEMILRKMNGAPPLLYFTVGALYNRAGNHEAAVKHLSLVLENAQGDEVNYLYSTPELRIYVDTLRKIENNPAEAPLSLAAVRALERTRRTRGKAILENSRQALEELAKENPVVPNQLSAAEERIKNAVFVNLSEPKQSVLQNTPKTPEETDMHGLHFLDISDFPIDGANRQNYSSNNFADDQNKDTRQTAEQSGERKPISEVLKDIYD